MWANRSGCSPKMSDVSKSLRLLSKNEQCEQIAQVAQQKWAMWANLSGRSPKMSDHERIAQVTHQNWANERIAHFFERITHLLIFLQKTSDSLRKPMSEFPALTPTTWLSDRAGGGKRLGGQMFGRRRWVLSILSLIQILWWDHSKAVRIHD